MGAVTPGQAATPDLFTRWFRIVYPYASQQTIDETWEGHLDAEREFWRELDARQPQPAPGDASGLLEPLHALAAKWDATAARNQRNGQSLVDQGDEYGSEGLAIAEALGACVVDLRAVLADAPEQPAPELATLRLAAVRAILLDENMSAEDARSRAAAAAYDGSPQPTAAPELAAAMAESRRYRKALEKVAGGEVGKGIAALRKIAVGALEGK